MIYKGFYPGLYASDISPADFYPSYIQTFIERDVCTLRNIGDLNTFARFLGLRAGRVGQVLNITSLANDAGISVNTAKSWISLLEASYIIYLLQPYYRNFNKRLIKSPKIYFYDTGLLSSLLKISKPNTVLTHYLYGNLFENLVISEILKIFYHKGLKPNVYYWRESNGTEIDCIIEHNYDKITAIEIKGGQTFTKDYLKNIKKLNSNDIKIDKKLIYAGETSATISGIELIAWDDFPVFLLNL